MKKMLKAIIVALVICLLSASTVFAVTTNASRVNDEAGILTSSERSELEAKLREVSDAHNVDVLVLTKLGLPDGYYGVYFDDDGDAGLMYYADDYVDYICQSEDAVCFALDMNDHGYAFSTYGAAFTAFSDYGQDYIFDKIRDDLHNGYYSDALMEYAKLADEFLTQAETGDPYDVNNKYKAPYPVLLCVGIAVVLGFFWGLIRAAINKDKLKSVEVKTEATDCVVPGSLNLTKTNDYFLYLKITRQKIESSSGSGTRSGSSGGSTSHVSSSGRSHGGSHGHF